MNEEPRIERRHLRVRLDQEDGVTSEVSPDGNSSVHGTVTVLGTGGACVELDETLAIGSPVSLSLTLPGTDEEILCGGVVRNKVSDHGLGIEFFFMNPSDREKLTSTVMERHLSSQP